MWIPLSCLVLLKVRRGYGSPGTGVMSGSEPPCGCWEWNLALLQGQQILLSPEPSLQSPKVIFNLNTKHWIWRMLVLVLWLHHPLCSVCPLVARGPFSPKQVSLLPPHTSKRLLAGPSLMCLFRQLPSEMGVCPLVLSIQPEFLSCIIHLYV